jgi:hypothetical protein
LNAARPELSAAQFSQISGDCATLSHDKPSQLKGALKTLCNQIVNGLPAATRSGERVICANL